MTFPKCSEGQVWPSCSVAVTRYQILTQREGFLAEKWDRNRSFCLCHSFLTVKMKKWGTEGHWGRMTSPQSFSPPKTGSGFTKEKQSFQSTQPCFHPTMAAKLAPGLTTQRTRDKMAQTNHRSWIKVPLGPDFALTHMTTKPTWQWNHIILRKKWSTNFIFWEITFPSLLQHCILKDYGHVMPRSVMNLDVSKGIMKY